MFRSRLKSVLFHTFNLSVILGIVWVHILILSPESLEDIEGQKFNNKVPNLMTTYLNQNDLITFNFDSTKNSKKE